jgi:hypothetical protein
LFEEFLTEKFFPIIIINKQCRKRIEKSEEMKGSPGLLQQSYPDRSKLFQCME